jgi:hypothetical protein
MKKLFLLAMLSALALAGTEATSASAPIRSAAVGSTPARSCTQARIGSGRQMSTPLAPVTCGSGEWCCRHDIGGTGACISCCSR